ncbi:MAG: hypothetical protein E7244_02455 [Enterocloster citroniae]|nr:hypothetical protein [Enterocloster citroniae]
MSRLEKRIRYLKRALFIYGSITVLYSLFWEWSIGIIGSFNPFEMIGGQPVWCGSACGVIFIMLAGVPDRLLIESRRLCFLYIIIGALGIVGCIPLGMLLGTTDDVLHGPMRMFFIVLTIIYIIPYLFISVFSFLIAADGTEVPETCPEVRMTKKRICSRIAVVFIMILGAGITYHGAERYYKPENISSWSRHAISNTGVSMLMPPGKRALGPDGEYPGVKKGVYAIGDRIMVFLFEKTDDTPEDPEEKGQVITLDEQVYTRDGIEYAKYITKTIYPGSSRPDYGISIEFEAYGREYAALVWSTRFDEVVKKDMDQILDSLEVDLDVQGKK